MDLRTIRHCLYCSILLCIFNGAYGQAGISVTGTDMNHNLIAIKEDKPRPINITCTNLITKNPISWSLPLALDVDEYSITSSSDGRSSSLNIPHPRRKHLGQYNCSTLISTKKELMTIVLAVSTEVQLKMLDETNDYITLHCNVLDTYPLPNINWFLNNKELDNENGFVHKISNYENVRGAVLELKKNEGKNNVTCEVHGQVSSKNATYFFNQGNGQKAGLVTVVVLAMLVGILAGDIGGLMAVF